VLKALLVGVGGFIGSVLRYALSGAAHAIATSATFPVGTLVVNLLGCFVLGVGSHLAETRGAFTDLTRAFFFIGILGGFTTFSAFSNETFNLFRSGDTALAWVNVASQLSGGLASVWLGRTLAYAVWR
jgi:fluoride exporter